MGFSAGLIRICIPGMLRNGIPGRLRICISGRLRSRRLVSVGKSLLCSAALPEGKSQDPQCPVRLPMFMGQGKAPHQKKTHLYPKSQFSVSLASIHLITDGAKEYKKQDSQKQPENPQKNPDQNFKYKQQSMYHSVTSEPSALQAVF